MVQRVYNPRISRKLDSSREIRGRDKFSRQDFLHPLPGFSRPSERSRDQSGEYACGEIEGSIATTTEFVLVVETKLVDLSLLRICIHQAWRRGEKWMEGKRFIAEGILRKGFLSRGKLLRSPFSRFSSPLPPPLSLAFFLKSEQLKRLSIVILNLAFPFVHRKGRKNLVPFPPFRLIYLVTCSPQRSQ